MIDEKKLDVDWQETRRFLDEKYFSKIRELSKKYDYPCENIAIDFNWVFGLIEKIEEQLKTDWIPCEEELPPQPKENQLYENKPLQVYLVSVKNCEEPFRAFWNGKDFTDGWSKLNVEAWMNLPQPYKKEGAE